MMTFCTYPDLSLCSDDPAMPDRTEQIGRLLQRAERLLEDVENTPIDTQPPARDAVRTSSGRPWGCYSSYAKDWPAIAETTVWSRWRPAPMAPARACYVVKLDHIDPLPDS